MMVNLEDLIGPSHPTMTPAEAQYAALTYISLGWAVTGGPGLDASGACSCHRGLRCGRNAGKHAHAGWGNDKRFTLTRDKAEAYWSPENTLWQERPVDQVFIVPYLSGLVVADVDDMEAWLRLPESDRPATLFQRSGSGRGGHFLYRFEWDTTKTEPPRLRGRLLNGAGEVKFRGIIGAAPNPHPSGGRYAWENWGHEIAPAPAWLVEERVVETWDGFTDLELLTGFWGDAMYAIDISDVERLGELQHGDGRPVVFFAVGSRLSRWVRAGRMTEQELVDKLMDSAEASGACRDYGEKDMERQIRNGIRAGMNGTKERA